MNQLVNYRKSCLALILALVMTVSTACGGAPVADSRQLPPGNNSARVNPGQTTQGNTPQGQDFGQWVVQKSRGLVSDAYVRDNDQLGVVISPKVQPNEVRSLANSLVQGFRQNFPNRDLTVLMYAPDRRLILTARYEDSNNQIYYE